MAAPQSEQANYLITQSFDCCACVLLKWEQALVVFFFSFWNLAFELYIEVKPLFLAVEFLSS